MGIGPISIEPFCSLSFSLTLSFFPLPLQDTALRSAFLRLDQFARCFGNLIFISPSSELPIRSAAPKRKHNLVATKFGKGEEKRGNELSSQQQQLTHFYALTDAFLVVVGVVAISIIILFLSMRCNNAKNKGHEQSNSNGFTKNSN